MTGLTDFTHYREVISYSRFSSRNQARGTSEARQADVADAFAAAHGITLSQRSCIDRGLSGFHGTNLSDGALGTLIQELRDGRIQLPALLLIERQDRFGRKATCSTLITLFQDLLGRGCDLYHLSQGRLYSEAVINSDFGALVTLAAECHAAHHYSATLSQRSAVAHQKARENMAAGKPVRVGWAPSWISHGPDGWFLNEYSKTIKRLLDLVASGSGYIATANQLNKEGLLSPRGKAWTAGGITHIVQSPSVAGGRPLRRRTGEVTWDYFPALLDREAWLALQATVASRHQGYSVPSANDQCMFIGQGITTCASCGHVVGYRVCSYVSRTEGRQRMAYVRCQGRKYKACAEPAVQLLPLVAHVLTRLQPSQLQLLVQNPDNGSIGRLRLEVERLEQQLKGAAAAVAAAEAEMASLMASGEATTAAVMARQVPALEAKVQALTTELQQATSTLQAATNEPSLEQLGKPLANLQQTFALGTDTAEQRRAVNAALRRMGLSIVLRSGERQVGLRLGSGAIHWQPLTTMDRAALFDGLAGWDQGRDGELIVEPQDVRRMPQA